MVTKRAGHKIRHKDQWSRTPRHKPHHFSYLIFDKGAKKHMLEKRQPPQQMGLGNCLFTCRRLKVDPYLVPIKINSKWIKNLKIRSESLPGTSGSCL
jgi:hypothetical protein